MSHINNKVFGLVLSLIMLTSSSSVMAAIIYDENISGDISAFNPLTVNFTEGSNIILGSTSAGDARSDYDRFSFFLESGYTLNSITYSIYNLHAENIKDLNQALTVRTTAPSYIPVLTQGRFVILDGTTPSISSISLFESSLPLEEGSYSIGVTARGWGGYSSTTALATWDYSIDFNVTSQNSSPVPLPAAGPLLVLGLLPLILFRRNRAY